MVRPSRGSFGAQLRVLKKYQPIAAARRCGSVNDEELESDLSWTIEQVTSAIRAYWVLPGRELVRVHGTASAMIQFVSRGCS